MTDAQPSDKVLEFHKLEPLPRVIRRAMLKAAIKAGKEPYAEGYEKGYEAAKTLMFEAGFREGYKTATEEAKGHVRVQTPALVQPVEIGLVAPDGSKLVVSEKENDYADGVVVVTERT